MPRKHANVWVIRYRGKYSVKEEGTGRAIVRPVSQKVAIAIARLIARANACELIIQGKRGSIRAKDSHGADAFPPRG